MRGEAFAYLRSSEAKHLQRSRGIEGRAHHAVPVIERIFRPADRARRAGGETLGDLDRLVLQHFILDAERDKQTVDWVGPAQAIDSNK
jgi:hypothetical protein